MLSVPVNVFHTTTEKGKHFLGLRLSLLVPFIKIGKEEDLALISKLPDKKKDKTIVWTKIKADIFLNYRVFDNVSDVKNSV